MMGFIRRKAAEPDLPGVPGGYDDGWLTRFETLPIIPTISLGIAALLIWAYFGTLDEVTIGAGKVTPTSRSQVIQSLEGGIVDGIFVHEGDIVQPRQKLATLDRARFSSTLARPKPRRGRWKRPLRASKPRSAVVRRSSAKPSARLRA